MLFNSFDFGLFLVIVYLAYWMIGTQRRKWQNILLLLSSYVFYGLWDWRFLGLLFLSSIIDYIAGRALYNTKTLATRKFYLWLSILWNLGVLFTFKYFNFFLDTFEGLFGLESSTGYTFWNLAIPLGLSFYTFQTMSYTIDVYHKKIKPTKNLLQFLCFVCFFPQLVAGPIERASDLLPQFARNRVFDFRQSKEGLRLILWGLFKKIIVAEKLGIATAAVFGNPEAYSGVSIAFASVLFSMQLYCDFSGYSEIAIGTARLFGFKLSKNFDLSYLATCVTDFWRRWHITLSTWFKDYVYVPLLQNWKKPNTIKTALALLITMILMGLWHGANWTFIFLGIFNGILLILERIPMFKGKRNLIEVAEKLPLLLAIGYSFCTFTVTALLFRARDMEQAALMLKRIFTFSMDGMTNSLIGHKLWYLVFMVAVEVYFRKEDYALENLDQKLPKAVRWAIYYTLIFFIIRYAEPKEAFIYFQF